MNNENLIPLSADNCWHKINAVHGTKGGVYKVIAVKLGERVPINRLLGTDPDGVLYIGKADSFLDRVIGLRKTLIYESSSHIFGRRFRNASNLKLEFPIESLYVELFQNENPAEQENKILDQYFQHYGEVPPLNAIL